MKVWKRSQVTCCFGCKSRTVEPNCHMFCPTYLAQKMAADAENAAAKEKAAVACGVEELRWNGYVKAKKKRR